jgi:hypothetical protein
VAGVALSAYFSAPNDDGDLLDALDRGLALLEAGLPL